VLLPRLRNRFIRARKDSKSEALSHPNKKQPANKAGGENPKVPRKTRRQLTKTRLGKPGSRKRTKQKQSKSIARRKGAKRR
jgi:hypothetical protein